MTSRKSVLNVDYVPIKGRFERWLLFRLFEFLFRDISFEIDFLDGDVRKIGKGQPGFRAAPPNLFRVLLILRNPNVLLPEAFVAGHWYIVRGELSELVVLMSHRKRGATNNDGPLMGLTSRLKYLYKQYINTKTLREVRGHYNEDPRIYELILDPRMTYSCAFFDEPDADLDSAQLAKLSTTFERLKLAEGHDLKTLDIGCGWGSFIFFASQKTGSGFDGISIAKSQIDYARDKLHKLPDHTQKRIQFFEADYEGFRRDESSIYDRIVSIGMLEHVGKTQYQKYFSDIHRLLKEGGVSLVHAIVTRESTSINGWLDKYIFPGGYIPRISEVVRGTEDAGLLMDVYYRHDGSNYQKTLRSWLQNLVRNEERCLSVLRENAIQHDIPEAKADQVARQAYRIWYFYLASIQWIFDKRGGAYDVAQFVLTKAAQIDA
jgi:cyclopropane-fatty-acyl-phospholipid synthase